MDEKFNLKPSKIIKKVEIKIQKSLNKTIIINDLNLDEKFNLKPSKIIVKRKENSSIRKIQLNDLKLDESKIIKNEQFLSFRDKNLDNDVI